jgi:hypothetical protein
VKALTNFEHKSSNVVAHSASPWRGRVLSGGLQS